jgi:hypothetical protein
MPGVKGRSGGHNRKLTNEKLKLGVHHRKRLNGESPDRISGEMIVFEGLGENGAKLREQFLPMLINNGTLSITDSVALHKFCRVAEDWFKADKLCAEKGRFYATKDENGNLVQEQFVWHKIECDLRAALDICIRDLGLSPASRDSIKKISTGKPVNRWAIK